MARSTSIDAYRDLIDMDVLGKKQAIVLEAVIKANLKYGAITAAELFDGYLSSQNLVFGNIRARLGELRDMGSIEERPKRIDLKTGKRVLTWHISGNKPVKITRIAKHERKKIVQDFMSVMLHDASDPKVKQDLKTLWRMVKEL